MRASGKESSYADFLLGLFFDPEDARDMFFQNIG
jgi:hypothetical protein